MIILHDILTFMRVFRALKYRTFVRVMALVLLLFFAGSVHALPGFFKSKSPKEDDKSKQEKKLGIFCDKCKTNSEETSLLVELEERNIQQDRISRYEFFDNGLLVKNIVHQGDASKGDLYKSEMKIIDPEKVERAKIFVEKLQKLEYSNFFPWKEDYYQRGNVVKFKFPDLIKLNCFKEKLGSKLNSDLDECPDAFVSQVFVYYTGHTESPELFAEILGFIKSL